MAHQFSSAASGSSSAHQGSVVTSARTSANQTSLDLNLSQKALQNPFKGGHDEAASVNHKAFEATATSQLDTGPKVSEVLTSDANGCTLATAKGVFEHTMATSEQQEHIHGLHALPKTVADPAMAAAQTGHHDPSVTAAEDELPVASESAGQKRRSPRVEAASNAQKDFLQVPTEDASLVVNGPMATPGLKRKSPRVKQTPDTNKKVILALEANDDEGPTRPRGRPRGSGGIWKDGVFSTPHSRSKSSAIKGDAPDLGERRLLLEERKIRLAEQRFLLEEKKLDATIEIGKGLIISMERMTNTISQLGNSSRSHQ